MFGVCPTEGGEESRATDDGSPLVARVLGVPHRAVRVASSRSDRSSRVSTCPPSGEVLARHLRPPPRILVVDTFYENVEGPDGKNQVIEFTPRDRESMLVACLWSAWTDPKRQEPDLLSFAAITDDPEPEVAEVGHDRTIINIKPEHIDAWLNPDPNNLAALYAIFDDKRHPFYEHRLAA